MDLRRLVAVDAAIIEVLSWNNASMQCRTQRAGGLGDVVVVGSHKAEGQSTRVRGKPPLTSLQNRGEEAEGKLGFSSRCHSAYLRLLKVGGWG